MLNFDLIIEDGIWKIGDCLISKITSDIDDNLKSNDLKKIDSIIKSVLETSEKLPKKIDFHCNNQTCSLSTAKYLVNQLANYLDKYPTILQFEIIYTGEILDKNGFKIYKEQLKEYINNLTDYGTDDAIENSSKIKKRPRSVSENLPETNSTLIDNITEHKKRKDNKTEAFEPSSDELTKNSNFAEILSELQHTNDEPAEVQLEIIKLTTKLARAESENTFLKQKNAELCSQLITSNQKLSTLENKFYLLEKKYTALESSKQNAEQIQTVPFNNIQPMMLMPINFAPQQQIMIQASPNWMPGFFQGNQLTPMYGSNTDTNNEQMPAINNTKKSNIKKR